MVGFCHGGNMPASHDGAVPSDDMWTAVNCANKMFNFQKRKRVTLIKITLGGAGGDILENYENMLTSLKLNLSEGNLFHKSCSK